MCWLGASSSPTLGTLPLAPRGQMRPRWSPEHTSPRHGRDGAVWECVAQGCPAPRGVCAASPCPKMQHLHPQLPDRAAQQRCPHMDAAMRWLRGVRGHGRFGGAASPQPRCWPWGCPVPWAGGSAWPRGSCSARPLAEAFVPTVLQKGLTQTIVGRKQKNPQSHCIRAGRRWFAFGPEQPL